MKRLNTQVAPARIGIYLLLLIIAVMAMIMLKLCSSKGSVAVRDGFQSQGDTIDVAIEYSPMTVYMIDDTLGGFSYDLLRELALENSVKFKFHPIVSVDDGLDGLEDGVYDICVADMPATLELQKRFLCVDAVMLDRLVLVQHVDTIGKRQVESQLELGGKEIWVPKESSARQRLENLGAEIGDTIYVREDDEHGSEHLFMLVELGEIPMAVINERSAKTLMRDSKHVDLSVKISFTQFQSWLLRRDERRLADSINAMLERYKASGKYNTLYNRYK